MASLSMFLSFLLSAITQRVNVKNVFVSATMELDLRHAAVQALSGIPTPITAIIQLMLDVRPERKNK